MAQDATRLGIPEEYATGMSGPKLAKKYGVGSTRTIYLILEKVRRKLTRTRGRREEWLLTPSS